MELRNAKKGLILITIAEAIGSLNISNTISNVSAPGEVQLVFRITTCLLALVAVFGAHIVSKDVPFFAKVRNVSMLYFVECVCSSIIDQMGMVSDYMLMSFVHLLCDSIVIFFVIKGVKSMYDLKGVKSRTYKLAFIAVLISVFLSFVNTLWVQTLSVLVDLQSDFVILVLVGLLVVIHFVSYVFYMIVLIGAIRLCGTGKPVIKEAA